ncbi:hypothetical protein AB0J90_16705 [Micromonospora sp. NPDC049523]|uniref:hypothetical protein n=1 Tax=unclassified Micromonospora TaxID=2617518 RepID=UPI002DD9F05C|nr:hypothetical protein [Micromonospora sp. NBC_01796]WSA88856.1 hypothetical protein OIE47_15295 [Micromonospora sp. NBC_01796]
MFVYAHVYARNRLAELREQVDRGDGPVPTAVIIVGLAVIAFALIGIATTFVDDWTGKLPGPDDPFPED